MRKGYYHQRIIVIRWEVKPTGGSDEEEGGSKWQTYVKKIHELSSWLVGLFITTNGWFLIVIALFTKIQIFLVSVLLPFVVVSPCRLVV